MMTRVVCLLALAVSLAVAGSSPALPLWGPEVSLNVSLGGSLQYSYSRQELYLFSEIPQLWDLDWDFFNYHEVIYEAPYFGMHLNCLDYTLSFYIPDVILGDLICYTLPSRISIDLINNACPLTNEAFQYMTQYKSSNVSYLGTLKYGYDGISAVYVWGVAKQNTWNYCCNSDNVSYREWCCPMYYDATTSRQPVAFRGRWGGVRSVYTSGWATPAPWTPPVSSTCRRINPDIAYSRRNPDVTSSKIHKMPPKPTTQDQGMESELEMEDAGHPLVALLWRKMQQSDSIFSAFGFMDMSEREVEPAQTNEMPPLKGTAQTFHVNHDKPGHVIKPDHVGKPQPGAMGGGSGHMGVQSGHEMKGMKMDH